MALRQRYPKLSKWSGGLRRALAERRRQSLLHWYVSCENGIQNLRKGSRKSE